jgi:hypothetical protein
MMTKSNLQKIGRGTPLAQASGALAEAITKGSLDYVMQHLTDDWGKQFPTMLIGEGEFKTSPWIVEIFADYVIAKDGGCDNDEYYRVPFTLKGDEYVFTTRDQWEKVELTYQPAKPESAGPASVTEMMSALGESAPAPTATPTPTAAPAATAPVTPTETVVTTTPTATPVAPAATTAPVAPVARTPKRKQIVERRVNDGAVVLEESDDETGYRKIRVDRAMTANVVNGNHRRYPTNVIAEAIDELKRHLHESAGQGRLMQVLGEAEHPSDKGNRRSQLLETVVKWDDVNFNGEHVSLHGRILGTSRGRDMIAVIEGGVTPGTSMRGYGDSKIITERGKQIEQVTELHITGFDLVSEPSFSDAQAILESHRDDPIVPAQPAAPVAVAPVVAPVVTTTPIQEESEMDPTKLKQLIESNPDLFKGLIEGKLDELSAEALHQVEETIRAKLNLAEGTDLGAALTQAANAVKQLDEQKQAKTIDNAIVESTKDLNYGKRMNEAFISAVRAAKLPDANAVQMFVEAKRVEYDQIVADARLASMGMRVLGPVLENDLGIPEFARAAKEFGEALVVRGHATGYDIRKPINRNQLFANRMLERFDALHKTKLIAEAKMLNEAEQTTDLNLPYSASRAIIQYAMAQLIASSVFDFDVVSESPVRIFYETYMADSNVVKIVAMGADTVHATALDVWYSFTSGNKRVEYGTLVVKNAAEAVTYTEGADFVVDYGDGKLMALTGGAIAGGDTVHLGYQYFASKKGEMGVIERGKGQLGYVVLDCQADRLAQQVAKEAIVFSQSQLGWDAVARTMAMIVEQIRRRIDRGAFLKGLNNALTVQNNIVGTWTSGADPLDDLVGLIGQAKVAVQRRYYDPQSAVLSVGRSNDLSNWLGFARTGFVNATIKDNGYVATIKGLNFFETTEFNDKAVLVTNKQQVMHRVFKPMSILGPFPSYDVTTMQMVAADEYYAEEYNGDACPIPGKASVVKIV